jgi:hypothetical protein
VMSRALQCLRRLPPAFSLARGHRWA